MIKIIKYCVSTLYYYLLPELLPILQRRREEGSGSWDFILELRTAEARSAETSTVVSTSSVETQYLIIFIIKLTYFLDW